MKVPLVDLATQMAEVEAEVRQGLKEVFATTAFIGGPAVARFETAYANMIGAAHCVGVGNGTDALELALRAVGVRAGGEVIIPANTFIATAEAISRIGATPVLVDVDPAHLLIDPGGVLAALSPRTEAIVPVHLFGQVAPMGELSAIAATAEVPIVEDAAQSHGARQHGRYAGTFGRAAGTSFYPGKNLGAAGDAGAVTTDDAETARAVRAMAAHGAAHKYDHDIVGFNSRLDALQAVVLEAKLTRLASWNTRRRVAAAYYSKLLRDVDGVQIPTSADGNEDVWHLYVVRVPDRDRVLDRLRATGVEAGVHYPRPVHLTGAYRHLGYPPGSFPVAEQAAQAILSLPIYPHIAREQQDHVVESLVVALG